MRAAPALVCFMYFIVQSSLSTHSCPFAFIRGRSARNLAYPVCLWLFVVDLRMSFSCVRALETLLQLETRQFLVTILHWSKGVTVLRT